MELQGRIIAAMPERGGVSQRTGNEWKVQEFVIETHDSYSKKMAFEVFGADRLARFKDFLQVGKEISVSFDIDAREYQGRWFNSIRAFDVRPVDAAATAATVTPAGSAFSATSAPTSATSAPTSDFGSADDSVGDGLPF